MEQPILISDSFPYREYAYKGDKIVEYAANDFVGFYLNADDEIETTKRCKTIGEAIVELDKYNKIVTEIKTENEKGE